MTETVLMTWGLVMILCIIVQVFLIDQYAYRLATTAHSKLFARTAFPDNRPSVMYETRWTQKFKGPDEYVPVIGFFALYGVTRDDLRIRSTHDRPGGYKRIKLGRGTLADVPTGVIAVGGDFSALWSLVITGSGILEDAMRKAK